MLLCSCHNIEKNKKKGLQYKCNKSIVFLVARQGTPNDKQNNKWTASSVGRAPDS